MLQYGFAQAFQQEQERHKMSMFYLSDKNKSWTMTTGPNRFILGLLVDRMGLVRGALPPNR